jgi:hypothetical protein
LKKKGQGGFITKIKFYSHSRPVSEYGVNSSGAYPVLDAGNPVFIIDPCFPGVGIGIPDDIGVDSKILFL